MINPSGRKVMTGERRKKTQEEKTTRLKDMKKSKRNNSEKFIFYRKFRIRIEQSISLT